MAKSIKAIKCPNCGSTQKTEVRPDVFRCEGCGTEYFLDNDDINVNYTVRDLTPPARPPLAPAKTGLVVGALVGVLLLATIGLRLLFSSGSSSAPSYSVSTADAEDYAQKFTFSSTESLLYLSPTQRPVLLQVGRRTYYRVTKDSTYAVFTDATTGKELKSFPLEVPAGTSSFPDFDLRLFANGDLYLVANKVAVYQVDKVSYRVRDVTKTLFQGESELVGGIAGVEAGDEDYGDYFELFTNDGRHLNYFPLTHAVYTKDDFYDARHSPRTLRANSPLQTKFQFTGRSTIYPEDKIQLIKYQQRDNGGGPRDRPRFEWGDDYGGSGIFTDADPHRKVLITARDLRNARVPSFADFTPGRLYFDARLLYADDDYVLLSFKPTAAPTARTSLQCLNARTGAIVFTQPLAADETPDTGVRYPGGFALHDGATPYTLTMQGQLTKHPNPA